MSPVASAFLLDTGGALAHPVVRATIGVVAVAITLGLLASWALAARAPALAKDVRVRTLMWIPMASAVLVPLLAGRLWTILFVCALSTLSFRELAIGTGLVRDRLVATLVALGIALVTFANLDHWPSLRTALVAIIPVTIVVLCVLQDSPPGFIQRCGLGTGSFLLFGLGLGRLGALASEVEYRALLCAIVLACQLSDVFAYTCGKALGGRHLFPHTSPNKTLGGHLGSLLLTAPLAAILYRACFDGTVLATWPHLCTMGLLTAALAQLGDLLLGSIKRDLGVKDLARILPGHGGVLDRCNSLLLVVPAMYHYVQGVQGVGGGFPTRLLSGGWSGP